MYGVALLLTVAAVGVDYGWQPGEDGQLEYIIQIEPGLIKTLSEGKVDLLSELPEELQHVRRFRIRVGTGEVPRTGLGTAQAGALKPADNLANQAPSLGSTSPFPANSARPAGTQRPGDSRGSPTAQPSTTQPNSAATQPGRVLTPPERNITIDSPLPGGNDRFPSSGDGASTLNNRGSGTDRSASQERTPIDYDSLNPPRGIASQTPVWDSTTNQWRTPAATTPPMTNVNEPRTNDAFDPRSPDPRTGIPEIRRDTAQDPRDPRAYNPNAYPPSGYAQNPPQGQWTPYPTPLRDPDPGAYAYPYPQRPTPAPYDPNLAMNRQVGYQVATAPAAGTSPPTAATTAPPPAVTKSSSREVDRADEAMKPWWPLTFTAMLLFGSIGLNFYLGWIAHGIYQRYRALLMEVRNVRAAAI